MIITAWRHCLSNGNAAAGAAAAVEAGKAIGCGASTAGGKTIAQAR